MTWLMANIKIRSGYSNISKLKARVIVAFGQSSYEGLLDVMNKFVSIFGTFD